MKSGPKPEKSVTFSGQDEIIWGSPPSSSSSMSSSVYSPKAEPGSVKPHARSRRCEMSAFDKAKLRLGIRTDGRGGILCSNKWPCCQAGCEACKRRIGRGDSRRDSAEDPSHRSRAWVVDDVDDSQPLLHCEPCATTKMVTKLEDGQCNHITDGGTKFGWLRCTNTLSPGDFGNGRPWCVMCSDHAGRQVCSCTCLGCQPHVSL